MRQLLRSTFVKSGTKALATRFEGQFRRKIKCRQQKRLSVHCKSEARGELGRATLFNASTNVDCNAGYGQYQDDSPRGCSIAVPAVHG
jgi:hypothetical protein